MWGFTLCPGLAIILQRERERELVALHCVVTPCSMSLPDGAVGWSVVCDCGISWSYSLGVFVGHISQMLHIKTKGE